MKSLIYLFFLLSTAVFAQNVKEKIIATVGNKQITEKEYKIRYELMPHISKNQDIVDSVKNEFVYSLIAEKLLALEAAEKDYDTTDIIKYSMQSIEKLYVKDALYKEEVEKKVKVNPKEIIAGSFRLGWSLKVNIISSADSAEIAGLYSQLRKGASFDSLLIKHDEYAGQQTPVTINFGDMTFEFVEDTLYNMKPGAISQPVHTEEGWFIFKLVAKEPNIEKKEKPDNISKKAEDVIHTRKAQKIERQFRKSFLSKAKVNTVGPLFYRIVEKSTAILAQKATLPENQTDIVNLEDNDVDSIMRQFGTDTLKLTLIRFEENPVSVKDFLYSFITDGFTVKQPTVESVGVKLRAFLHTYIDNELLSREAYRRGMQNLPEVKREMEWWRENYISHILKNQIYDSTKISDEEITDYYKKNNSGGSITEVNIIEILTSSLQDIEAIMNGLQKGTDFKALAKQYNKRESSKDKDGESGFFPVTMYGEIGRTADRMKIGDVYGPLKVEDGYSIFKLIDRKEKRDSLTKTFEEIKEQLKEDLFSRKLGDSFNKYTASLAVKYGVKVNRQALKNIRVSEINMFTSRIMGFGGRMTAIPYTPPLYEWVKELKNNLNL
ncbi:MAG: peptidylprolyl isomerase [Ignavibacteria bacterium]